MGATVFYLLMLQKYIISKQKILKQKTIQNEKGKIECINLLNE